MKFNILRLIAIVVICLLGITLWYLYDFDRTAKKKISVLVQEKATFEKKAGQFATEKLTLQDEAARITKERDALVAKLSDFEQKMKDSEDNVRLMAVEIEKVKAEIAAKDTELKLKYGEIAGLQQAVVNYKSEVKKLNKRILQNMEAAKAEAQARVSKPGGTTLEPITVTAKSARSDSFLVADINRDYNFLVINAGRPDNIQVGDSLCVFRGKELLGRVVVEKVGEDGSVAKILYKTLADKVKKGDTVKY